MQIRSQNFPKAKWSIFLVDKVSIGGKFCRSLFSKYPIPLTDDVSITQRANAPPRALRAPIQTWLKANLMFSWFNFLKTTTHSRLSLGNINNTVIRDMQIHTDVEEGNWEAKEVPSLYCSLEVGFFIDPVSDSWSDGASSFFFPLLTHGRAKTITACVARCSRPFRVISPRLFQLSARLYQGGGRYTLYTKYRIVSAVSNRY